MDEQEMRSIVDELAQLEFTGTDERAAVAATVDGAGRIVRFRVDQHAIRKLPAPVFASCVMAAFVNARDAAATPDGAPASTLRDHGINLDFARRIME